MLVGSGHPGCTIGRMRRCIGRHLIAGITPFNDTLGDIVRRRFRSTYGTQQRGKNDRGRFSNVDSAALVIEAQAHDAGGEVDARLDIHERGITQTVYDTGGRLKPRRQQRVALHPIALDRHYAREAAESDRCRHRKSREQRNRPQHRHQDHSAARVAPFHCITFPPRGRRPAPKARQTGTRRWRQIVRRPREHWPGPRNRIRRADRRRWHGLAE